MSSKLIILRGNSGSGKSSTAKRLQERLGEGTLLVSQDVLRRQMLRTKDTVGNLSILLNETIIKFGMENCNYVIVEGIYTKRKHGENLIKLIEQYKGSSFVYYFDIPFEETLRRHQFKDVSFGETEMRKWFLDKDVLGVAGERLITEDLNQEEIVEQILKDLSYEN